VTESVRFRDHDRPLAAFSDLIYVVCPGCGGRAVVVPRPGLPELRYYSQVQFRPRRLACPHCALVRDWTAQRRNNTLVGVAIGGPSDPFFGLPLWLQVPCRGQLLWAYNQRHIDTLQRYVAAKLREHPVDPDFGMLGRLPAWMKAARNRFAMLRGLRQLSTRLQVTAPATGSPAAIHRPGAKGTPATVSATGAGAATRAPGSDRTSSLGTLPPQRPAPAHDQQMPLP